MKIDWRKSSMLIPKWLESVLVITFPLEFGKLFCFAENISSTPQLYRTSHSLIMTHHNINRLNHRFRKKSDDQKNNFQVNSNSDNYSGTWCGLGCLSMSILSDDSMNFLFWKMYFMKSLESYQVHFLGSEMNSIYFNGILNCWKF